MPEELDGAVVSSHYYLFEIDNSQLTQSWLDQFVKAGRLQRQVDAVGSTNYASIRPQDVLTFQIPLPDIAEQRRASKLDAVDQTICRTQSHDALIATKHVVMRKLWRTREKASWWSCRVWPIGSITATIDKVPSLGWWR